MDRDLDVIGLRARAMRGMPGPRKATRSWSEVCDDRATAAFGEAVEAGGGQRACARHMDHSPTSVRDKVAGARNIHLKDVFGMPPVAVRRVALALLDWADEVESGPYGSRTGS